MALVSKLFAGDPKLEAAASSHAGHVTPGSSGGHVKKIQIALNTLDDAGLSLTGDYDARTASAVLKYKTKRRIINFSYQKTADNVVGIMTIAALDAEMTLSESAPIFVIPQHPGSSDGGRILLEYNKSQHALASFAADGGKPNFPTPPPAPPVFPPQPPPPNFPPGFKLDIKDSQVIIPPGGRGSVRVVMAAGGRLLCDQTRPKFGKGRNNAKVARLPGEVLVSAGIFAVPIKSNDETLEFIGENCGETEILADLVRSNVTKTSNRLRVLCLIDKALVLTLPSGDYTPNPNFKTGLLTNAGTPLNPKKGRKINMFGEGETPDFEDYSSLLDFCSHTFSNGNGPPGQAMGHRPWTDDPRKTSGPGIKDKSIDNISCRGSPISPETINEFLRIGAPKCRLTYAEAIGKSQSTKLKAGLTGAVLIEEGAWGGNGHAMIFELP